MNYLKVNLWGQEVGRLVWDSRKKRTYFLYSSDAADIPEFAPLLYPTKNRQLRAPYYGDDRRIYQGLPPFIADSLPDSWGNALFDDWVRNNKIPRDKATPLYKLMFIGTRGMGALEYEPAAADLAHTRKIDIKSLYELSLKVIEDRENMVLSSNEEITMQALLAVGTSAGGRQMKAIIAINNETGEIRSGQTSGLDGFDYYILKFGNNEMPIAEIETAYYNMAIDAGINMEECRILTADGTNHFLTKRFDRKDGKKIHLQTLAAINPEARSYEDLVATCRELSLPESEIEQLFTRMVFNVLANNTDDHIKNFSFLLEEHGTWHLTPAYDMTYIFNINGTGPNTSHVFSIGGKISNISKEDLLDFAKQNEIRNSNSIINRVAESVKNFDEYAEKYGVTYPWRGIIQKTLNDNLTRFGFLESNAAGDNTFTDKGGRNISGFNIAINTKGHYDITATINGTRNRRFIRQNMPLHDYLSKKDMFNLTIDEKTRLIEDLFPTG